MHDFLTHLTAKTYQNRKVALMENGSWAPSAIRTMKSILEGMKDVEILDTSVTIKSAFKESDVPAVEALADAVVEAGK